MISLDGITSAVKLHLEVGDGDVRQRFVHLAFRERPESCSTVKVQGITGVIPLSLMEEHDVIVSYFGGYT